MRGFLAPFFIALALTSAVCAQEQTPPSSAAVSGAYSNPLLAHGKAVKGLNGIDGRVVGAPLAGSKFSKLEVGMLIDDVVKVTGEPTLFYGDTNGKPYLFATKEDMSQVMLFRGHGKLVFDGTGHDPKADRHLIGIVHDPKETGVR